MATVRVEPRPAARPSLRARWGWRLGSAAAGGLPALAFPEAGMAWLAQVGLVPLLLLVAAARSPREAAVRAWLGGAGYVAGVHHWLAGVTGPLLAVIVLALGVLWPGWGALAWQLLRGPRTPARVVLTAAALASGWVLTEVARSWEYLGGPFGLLGASQWATPGMLAPAAAGGVWAVSFLAVMVNVGLTAAVLPTQPGQAGSAGPRQTAGDTQAAGGRQAAGRAAGLVVAVAAAAAGPVWQALWLPPEPVGHVRVGVVQVGMVQGPATRFALAEQFTRQLDNQAENATVRPSDNPSDNQTDNQTDNQAVDLVVWGESSVGADLAARPDLTRRLQRLAAELDAPLLVNTDAQRAGGGGIFKSTVVVDADGIQGRYDKQRLVPFGEYIPFRGAFGWLAGVTDAAAVDRRRGDGPRLLDAGGVRVGPLVCFETAFADMTRHLAGRGAELLVGQSSTATFQGTWAPEQHASLAAVRAVETGRPMVHATLTGVTAVADARGARLLWVPADQRGSWSVTVPLTAGTTPFVRWGAWVPAGSAVLLAAVLTAGAARRVTSGPGVTSGRRVSVGRWSLGGRSMGEGRLDEPRPPERPRRSA